MSDEHHAAGLSDINEEILVEKRRSKKGEHKTEEKTATGIYRERGLACIDRPIQKRNQAAADRTETILSHGILPKSYTGGIGGGGGIGGAALPFGSGVSEELSEFQAGLDKDQAVVLKVRQGRECCSPCSSLPSEVES